MPRSSNNRINNTVVNKYMYQNISPKITSFTFSILALAFLVVVYAAAWTEPTQTPPGGNVATPLNSGNVGQTKAGGLIVNTGGAVNGLVIDKGNICLGTNCISSWPGIPSGMIAMFNTTCPSGWTIFAALDGRFPRGSTTYGGTGGGSSHSHNYSGVTNSPSQDSWYDGSNNRYATVYNHTHAYSGITDSASNLPPYLDVIWCKKN